ncbi:MAG: biotin/lipoyl-containing protein [Puniceicoccaceae bacterium]
MNKLRVTVDGKAYEVEVEFLDQPELASGTAQASPPAPRRARAAAVSTPPASQAPARTAQGSSSPGDVLSPLAAVVVSISVAKGEAVKAGQKIAVLEAMKMNTEVAAPSEGTVTQIYVAAGDSVEEGQPIISIE